jgi:hypothetical protein
MLDSFADFLIVAIPMFCFGYPFIMSWYWMAGGALFYVTREISSDAQGGPQPGEAWPPISILVPCYNEGDNAQETLGTAAAVDYPAFEIIAINDGSRDNTGEVLDGLAKRIQNLRVVHLAANQGKATALNAGALLAKHELLVCIDGDALLDPQALYWIARDFRRATVGGLAGNPRIRNRTSLLGRLQVGEFSSIIGLIRRAQTTYGRLFTVSGVMCLPQACPRRGRLVVAAHHHRRHRRHLASAVRRLAGHLRAARHRLDSHARDAQRPVEAAPALGGRRRADDGRLLRPHGALLQSVLAADLHQLPAQPPVGLCHDLFADHRPVVDCRPRAAQGPAGFPAHPGMVGAYTHHHLPHAGAGQRPARTAFRGAHAAVAVLDDLVSVGVLDDQHRDRRRCLADRAPATAQGANDLGES